MRKPPKGDILFINLKKFVFSFKKKNYFFPVFSVDPSLTLSSLGSHQSNASAASGVKSEHSNNIISNLFKGHEMKVTVTGGSNGRTTGLGHLTRSQVKLTVVFKYCM